MKRLTIVILTILVITMTTGCSSGASRSYSTASSSSSNIKNSYGITNATADTVFGMPDRFTYHGGFVGVFRASSSDCSVENITTWYNQYVKHGLDDWDVIEYTDKPGFGVYAGAGMVEVNTEFDSNYMTIGSNNSSLYVFKEGESLQDGELVPVG